ncbi:hypothetical protein HB780_11050 (plasmid) [Rhizobium lusitanum]|uniref:hypothetical protein n=1 Tax=Rhizobium lusitanum TaxID=293958 RepID=UPI001611606A|nr:hypothetical protein [Rhizobium lusitanum]QND46189.1 hypothetical protein HB780_11050 [Rhizobium lusitanum]
MNNIVLFRGRTSVSKFPVIRALPANSGSPRPVLVAVWHTNPLSGKLECFWTTQAQLPVEEDGSRHIDNHRTA